MQVELRSEFIDTNNITLHVMRAGHPEDPLIIFLHGFPEYWKSFALQVQSMTDAGYQVMLPDQRGYNLSDKPHRIGSYKVDKLAQDILGLIHHASKETAVIVGHDWGGLVTWYLAAHYPHRVDRTVVLNAPHGSVFTKFYKTNPEQHKRSAYIKWFQLPYLPQKRLKSKNFKNLADRLIASSRENTFSETDITGLKVAWGQKRAMPCMLNWYRAIARRRLRITSKIVDKPHLIIWGAKDNFLLADMAEASLKYCKKGSLKLVDDATHWIQHEEPEMVSSEILSFLNS
ncbi:MAG: alpha/beta hydrolase [Candidatus Heimdallarchaeota archaeon]|nr:alpha/beta hydrolase [Candidatus Heimdallarchaeota archaeon]